jgi:glycine oxidase
MPNTQNKHIQEFDVILLGGGMVGLALAWEELQRGKKVLVLDSGPLMGKSSGAAAGILTHRGAKWFGSPFRALQMYSAEYYPGWLDNLNSHCKNPVHFDSQSEFQFYHTHSPEGKESYELELHKLEREQSTSHVFSPSIPSSITKHIALPATEYESIFYPHERTISPLALAQNLQEAGCQKGGLYWGHVALDSMEYDSMQHTWKLAGTLDNKSTSFAVTSEYLGITAGIYSNQILRKLGWELPLVPVKGQTFHIPRLFSEDVLLHLDTSLYLVPRGDTCMVGATSIAREDSEYWDELITTSLHTHFSKWIKDAPNLISKLSKPRVGVRPKAKDRYPFMGWIDKTQKLFVSTAHFKSGVGMAPFSAKYMSHLIHEDPEQHILEEFKGYESMDPLRKKGIKKVEVFL